MSDDYRKTKIGFIPKDWELVTLEDIGGTYGGLKNKTKEDFGTGKPYIPFLNILNNPKIDINSFDYVDVHENEEQNRIKKGDLFFNTSSETPEEVGMCSVLNDDISELYLNSFCFGFRIKDQISLNPLFVAYFFRSDFGRKVMLPLAQGMTRYNLSKRYFVKLKIPKPRSSEQRKIAEILSTVDEAISKTDAIIEETRQLKKGLMQKLFTEGIGHTRFKDTKIGRIPEEWELEILENLTKAPICYGIVQPGASLKEGIPTLAIRDLFGDYINQFHVTAPEIEMKYKRSRVEGGDLLISVKGTIGLINKVPEFFKGNITRDVARIRLNGIIEPDFVMQIITNERYQNYIKRLTVGSTRLELSIGVLKKLLIPIPSFEEQYQIAHILSEVDAKIENEEAFRTELEQLKKGLMQVLLTGKVRVKVDEGEIEAEA